MLKNITLSICSLFFLFSTTYSQCLMYEIPLDQRINNANIIIEGKVVSQHAFWNIEHTLIYTANTIDIYKIFKGTVATSQINIITEGGMLETRLHVVEPSLQLEVGQTGIFFLSPTANPYITNSFDSFEPHASAQGHIKYDLITQTANDPFKKYPTINTSLYSLIEQRLGVKYKELKPLIIPYSSQKNAAAISVTSFSPDTVGGGIGDVLTINGSDFGSSYSGSANVEFKNPDDGGATYGSVPADHIISWSDSQIMLTVPGKYNTGTSKGAGTGTIRVTNSGGTSAESSSTLVVVYNESSISYSGAYYLPKLVDYNLSGGYTWVFNTDFYNNTAAVDAVNSAFSTWNCGSQVNFTTSGTTSTSCNADDVENIISFDVNCALSTGVLGKSFTYYTGCYTSDWNWYVEGNDIMFAVAPGTSGKTWNYGPSATSSSQYDFQSVATHEIGHSHQLSHIISSGKVMHYALTNGNDVRTLDVMHDIGGGEDIMGRSMIANSCGSGAMLPFQCCISQITADFQASTTSTSTNVSIQFTDLTSGATTWAWDFGDGTSSALQNPSHSYSSDGTYSVTLIVDNGSGCADTLQKGNYIVIATQTGINNLISNAAITITPNPFNNEAVIEINNNQFPINELTLNWFTVLGKKVDINTSYENGKIVLHRNNIPTGIYYGHIIYNQQILNNMKIIIQ